MKNILRLLLLFILSPLVSGAHGYWLEVDHQAEINKPILIKMFYGEYASQIREVGKRLDKMNLIRVSVVDPNGQVYELKMQQNHTHWEGEFTPKLKGSYQVLGINDTREVQDWEKHKLGITRPIQYLRSQFTVEAGEISSHHLQFLDAYCQINSRNIELYAMKDGQPFTKTKVRIVNPDGWLQDKFSNAIGFVSVVPNKRGLYLVEIEWIEEVPGVYNGKPYETIRHKMDMTFFSDNNMISNL